MKINKKLLLIILIVIVILISIIFVKINYKKMSFGNNIIGNTCEDISKNILNINSYKAKAEITISSNKNENKYIVEQEHVNNNVSKQTVFEPSNIEGLTVTNEDNKLTINNTKLNLTKIYENYNYISNNHLFLDTFIENFKQENESKIEEKNDKIIMKTKIKDNNRYLINKTLYIDKQTKKPIEMKIEDLNQNVIVYIVYKEITINSM